MPHRPRLSESFAEGLSIAAKARGVRAYIPGWAIICLALGSFAAWSLPAAFWKDTEWGTSMTFYGGLLAFDGLLLAIGWGAFAKIYEIIGTGDFAAFLRRNGLLPLHFLYIDLAQAALVLAALSTGTAAVMTLADVVLILDRAMMALSIGTSCYAVVKAMSATSAMHDLIWERANLPSATNPPLAVVGK
jgi:hypothetical protein